MLREKVRELLDEYYGNSRSEDHKEEIVDFIENFEMTLLQILDDGDFYLDS